MKTLNKTRKVRKALNKTQKTFNKTQARDNFFKLYDTIMEDHELIEVIGKEGKMYMLSEREYESLREMIYIYSVPGLPEKIKEGMNAPLEECTDQLEWE